MMLTRSSWLTSLRASISLTSRWVFSETSSRVSASRVIAPRRASSRGSRAVMAERVCDPACYTRQSGTDEVTRRARNAPPRRSVSSACWKARCSRTCARSGEQPSSPGIKANDRSEGTGISRAAARASSQRRCAQRPVARPRATIATPTPTPHMTPATPQWCAIRTSLSRTSYKSRKSSESSAPNAELCGNACRCAHYQAVSTKRHPERTATDEVGRTVAIPSRSESQEQPEGVDWASVGQYIGEHRRRLGLSKNEASRRARVSNTTWRQIEAGQNDHPTDETLVRMARALLLDPAELMRLCQRRYVDAPSVRDLPPLGPPMALLEVLESDRRLDPRARRVLMELYDLLASR